MEVNTERKLLALAVELGARKVRPCSAAETRLIRRLPKVSAALAREAKQRIGNGEDPLGDAFCRLRSPRQRRRQGAVYTPPQIVSAMMDWAAEHARPVRVVEPGCGSGRFLAAAGRRFRRRQLVGVEIDPVPAILARGHLAAAGLAPRSTVRLGDFRQVRLPRIDGKTLWIGNPPYVRHHDIEPHWKQWFADQAAKLGIKASRLAGLHAHFFLAIARSARKGDIGALITSAEWLDVNYGAVMRDLLLDGLGGKAIAVLDPSAMPFPGATTTGAITLFEVGSRPTSMALKRIAAGRPISGLDRGRRVARSRLEASRRWSPLFGPRRKTPAGCVELGELCRVHRGQVTGANRVWIAGPQAAGLPDSVLFPAVTGATELFDAGRAINGDAHLRRVIDLPVDLGRFSARQRRKIDRFLAWAISEGADRTYIARHRKAWWAVGLRAPAPILCTYMARRKPAFVLNLAGVRHINIAHGLYPRERFNRKTLDRLVVWLSERTELGDGRTYAGGLTKFEPGEIQRILVPRPELLRSTEGEGLGRCETA